MGFGPVNVGLWQVTGALEAGDPDQVIPVAERLRPIESARWYLRSAADGDTHRG